MFTCDRCNYTTKYKYCLIQHLNNKKPCNVLNIDIERKDLLDKLIVKTYNDITYDCDFCLRKFNNATNMYKHKKICKSKPLDEITQLKNTVGQLVSKIDDQQSQIECLKKQPPNITNNTQININSTPPNNVKLRDFGMENMDAVPNSLMSYLFAELRFRDLLSQLHCDPNFPENQNIRIRSIKRNTMEIFRNNKWDIVSFSKGLNDLLLQGHRIFKDFYKNDKERILEEDMDEADLREILSQLQKIENLNKNEIKPLIEDLQMMLEEFKSTGSAIVIL
jgi:hypothetical protein